MYGNRNEDRIPSGDFDNEERDDLLYYPSADGLYRFYTITATGRFTPISDVGYTDTGWNQILAGRFGVGQGADLVFYQPGAIQALASSKTDLVPITYATAIRANLIFTVPD
jgi:hypothetical protein